MLQTAFKKLLFLAICLFLGTPQYAQQATLQGTVFDKKSKEPLYPATIKIGETGTITDIDGQFEIKLDAGDKQLEISYIGYQTIEQNITLKAGETTHLDFTLLEEVNLLQTATVSTGKYEKPLGEVTVSLEVLKSDLIESTNAKSLSQTLEKVPGVNMIGGQANIRGGSGYSYGAGSRVLLLVNDLPALQADAGTSNWSDLPIENIEQVEIIKGAASALYGSAAMNGLINVRTGYAKSKPETKISIFGGLFDAPKDGAKKWWNDTKYDAGLLFSHKQKFGKLDLVLGARYYKKEDVRENFDSEQGRVSAGMRYRLTDRFFIGLNATYNKQDNHSYFYWLDTAEGNYQADTATLSNSTPTRFYIDPSISYFDKADNHHKFNGRFFSIDNKSSTGTDNFSDLFYGSYQFQRKFKTVDLVLTAGLVASKTDVVAPLYGDTSYVLTNNAVFLQIEKKLFKRLNLSGGIRYEYNKIQGPEQIAGFTIPDGRTSDSRTILRFGANYKAGEKTYFRASWGEGFRFPTIAEKFIKTDFGGTPISPNPELISETGWSSEVGIKQGFTISNWSGFLDVAGFWMEYEDMIEFIFVGFTEGFQATNIGNTVIKGIDASIQGQGNLFGIPTSIIAGYTYIDPKFKTFTEQDKLRSSANNNILKYRFKHTVKIDIESEFKKFHIGVAMFRNSHIEAIDAIFESIIVPDLKDYRATNNSGYYLFNARLSYQINDYLKTSFLVNNLTNVEYTTRPGLLEATRLWSMRVDYKF